MTPGQLLISTRNSPLGDATRRSTSLIEPSSAMNSKLVQARNGSRSGNPSRINSSASRSHWNSDGAIACHRGGDIPISKVQQTSSCVVDNSEDSLTPAKPLSDFCTEHKCRGKTAQSDSPKSTRIRQGEGSGLNVKE